MPFTEHHTQAWIDRNTAVANRTEELSDAFKCGERFEQLATFLKASGEDALLPHLLDAAVNEWDLDMRDPQVDENFCEGSPIAAQIWGAN